MTLLPKDSNDNVIPALRIKDGAAHSISTSVTPAVNASAFDANTRVISLYATKDVYLKFGVSDTVEASSSDHFFPAGIYYDVSIGGGDSGQYSYVSALRVAEDGVVYISEKV